MKGYTVINTFAKNCKSTSFVQMVLVTPFVKQRHFQYKKKGRQLSSCITSKCSECPAAAERSLKTYSGLPAPKPHPARALWQSILQPSAAKKPAGSVCHGYNSTQPLMLDLLVLDTPQACLGSWNVLCNIRLFKCNPICHFRILHAASRFCLYKNRWKWKFKLKLVCEVWSQDVKF